MNLRRLGPKPSALARLSYAPMHGSINNHQKGAFRNDYLAISRIYYGQKQAEAHGTGLRLLREGAQDFLAAVSWSSNSLSFLMLGGLPTSASTSGISSPSSFIMVPHPVIMTMGVVGDSALMVRTT